MEGDTIPKILKRTAECYWDNKVALRHKKLGRWHKYTWKYNYENVKHFALGLMSLGLKHGDKVSIIGDPEPYGYWAQMATMSVGAIIVNIWPTARREEIEYTIQHSDTAFVVAQDQEAVDKVLEMRESFPNVGRVIYWDTKGMWSYDDPMLMSFEQVLKLGQGVEKNEVEAKRWYKRAEENE